MRYASGWSYAIRRRLTLIPNEEEDTKLSIVTSETQKQAYQKFVIAIKRAKRDGVDVAGMFLEVEERRALAWVRAFGLMLGVIWIFFSPLVVPAYKVLCFRLQMPYDLPEWFYYWPPAIGIVSILAFGYDLIDPRTLRRITGKDVPPASDLTQSGNFQIGKEIIDKLRNKKDES